MEFGDSGHRQGYCLYKLGCKGPETYANCSTLGFGDAGENTWPVGCGHPCIGCTEQGVGFHQADPPW
jgi:hydrogenase small subunit